MNTDVHLMTHYFFCTGVIDQLSQQARTHSQLFGEGQIELIYHLGRYSQIISEIEQSINAEEGFPGVFDYEVSEALAAELWVELCEQNEKSEPWDFPDESQFRDRIQRLMDDWINERIPREQTIQQWRERQRKRQR